MKNSLTLNPIIAREFKTTFRRKNHFFAFAIYCLLLTVICAVFINGGFFDGAGRGADISSPQALYSALLSAQMIFAMTAVISVASASVSGERERQTLDLLLVTRMSPFAIVMGKIMAAVGYIAAIIISSMPVMAVLLCFGQISLGGLVVVYAFMLVTVFMGASAAVFFSSYAKKTVVATSCSLLTMGALCLCSPILSLIYVALKTAPQAATLQNVNWLFLFFLNAPNPALGFFSALNPSFNIVRYFGGYAALNADTAPFGFAWLANMGVSLVISAIFIALATVRIAFLGGRR